MTALSFASVRFFVGSADTLTPALLESVGFKRGRPGVAPSKSAGIVAQREIVFVLASTLRDTDSLETHVDGLLAHLEAHEANVAQARDAVRAADVFCGCISADGQAGFRLSTRSLNRIVRFRLELVLDLYPPGAHE